MYTIKESELNDVKENLEEVLDSFSEKEASALYCLDIENSKTRKIIRLRKHIAVIDGEQKKVLMITDVSDSIEI